ncbi:hypothetical protein [Aminobacter sp. MET-1]|uniref:hypothetical protein n=1 Tax=Aminobacter sp. MET-1 TaxID=2951085 RepID=UPI00226A52BA|nr:hypothetical protein [Aminobacter sp. MET-1]MCX8572982.1 hypothetical protein [Aminobacter sp. MET-1]
MANDGGRVCVAISAIVSFLRRSTQVVPALVFLAAFGSVVEARAEDVLVLCSGHELGRFATEDEANAKCPVGSRVQKGRPGWCVLAWYCEGAGSTPSSEPTPPVEAIGPATNAARDLFGELPPDQKKEYDEKIENLFSAQSKRESLPAENPFRKASDAAPEMPPLGSSPTQQPTKKNASSDRPPIVCPPNPSGCIAVEELGPSSLQLASKFIQSCDGVLISFKWKSCGRLYCSENVVTDMPEGESWINYTSKTYPSAYDVSCRTK